MQTASIQTRVPKDLKEKAGKIFRRLGIDFSTANRLFYSRVIEERGIPFSIKIKKKSTKSADDLTEKQEKNFSRQVADRGLRELWDNPKDDSWDEFYKNTSSLRS